MKKEPDLHVEEGVGGWDRVGLGRQVDSNRPRGGAQGQWEGGGWTIWQLGLTWNYPVDSSDHMGGIFFPFA